eukprot:COSAG01_NODE_529_length_15890_cov_548.099994_1_plen_86_part_00
MANRIESGDYYQFNHMYYSWMAWVLLAGATSADTAERTESIGILQPYKVFDSCALPCVHNVANGWPRATTYHLTTCNPVATSLLH